MRRLFIAFAMLFSIFGNLRAQEIKVVFEEWPPYEFTKDGKPEGIHTEIVSEAFDRMGLIPTFISVPWARALNDIKTGRAEVIYPLTKTPEREKIMNFVEPQINSYRVVLFARKDSSLNILNINDLKGLKVAQIRGHFLGAAFNNAKRFKHVYAADQKELFRLLTTGIVDLIATSDLVGSDMVKELGIVEKVKMLPFTISVLPLYIGVSKAGGDKNKALQDKLSKVLMQMKAEGVIDRKTGKK